MAEKRKNNLTRIRLRYFSILIAFFAVPFLFSTVKSDEDIPNYFVPAPPFSEGIYPCSNCHGAMETNVLRRELTFHQEIKLKNHAEEQRWCLDCHDKNDRDKLRLASGKLITFEESRLWPTGFSKTTLVFSVTKPTFCNCLHIVPNNFGAVER